MGEWAIFFAFSTIGLILGAIGVTGLIYMIKDD